MPQRPSDYPLNDRQYELLQELVRTPSWFSQRGGNDEALILDKIEDMLSQRMDAEIHRVDGDPRPSKVSLDPFRRKSVFAERGTLKDPSFTVMLYAHIDTVFPDGFPKEWSNPLQLSRDGDRLSGLGAYDMKAGAMEVIDIFREVDVPQGVRLQAALCHDEEMESYGALDLVEWLKAKGKVPDLILSPEIATLSKRQEADMPKKDIIVNRIGHVKSLFKLIVPQAHRFETSALDAETEYMVLRNHIDAYFQKEKKQHKFFGKRGEDLKINEVMIPRAKGFSNTTEASFRMSYLNVPGHTVREVMEWEMRRIEECDKIRRWTKKGAEILFNQTPNETSYEPYALDLESPKEKMVLSSVASVYGGYKLKGGGSTSDANVFNALLPDAPCFDIGPIGGKAHNREEWVSAASIAKNIEWQRHVITTAIPELLASRK